MIGLLVKHAKTFAILGIVIVLVTAGGIAYNKVYDAGYLAAELKWRNAQQAAIADAVAAAREQWDEAAAVAAENLEKETEIVERVRIVEREVPKIVERVVRAECRDLGPDIQRVYNDAIRASDAAGEDVDGPTEPSQ